MKALTLWQPWASLIAGGFKDVENRDWRPPGSLLGKRIAIHAGKHWDADFGAGDWPVAPTGFQFSRVDLGITPRGAILATARLVTAGTSLDPRVANSPWFCGYFGWLLDQVVAFEPIPCRGAQGLWNVPDEALALIAARGGA